MSSFKFEKVNIQEAESLKDLMPPARWEKDIYRGKGDEIPSATENWVMKKSFIREVLRASISYFSKDPNRPLLYSDIFNEIYSGGITPYSMRGYHFSVLVPAQQRGLLVMREVPVSEHNNKQTEMRRQQEKFVSDLEGALETTFTEESSKTDKIEEATTLAPPGAQTIRIQLTDFKDYQIIPTQQAISFLKRSEKLLGLLEAERVKE